MNRLFKNLYIFYKRYIQRHVFYRRYKVDKLKTIEEFKSDFAKEEVPGGYILIDDEIPIVRAKAIKKAEIKQKD